MSDPPTSIELVFDTSLLGADLATPVRASAASAVEITLVALLRLASREKPPPSENPPTRHDNGSSWQDAHPEAAALYGVLPGPSLAAALAGLDVANADPETLIEATAAWERMASWAVAEQARAIGELYRRRSAQRCGEYVGDEVAACLATTRAAGEAKVGRALCLGSLPAVADALLRGEIDARKADLFADELVALGERDARAVADELLPDAPLLTVPQLRARIRRAELALNPAAAAIRHQRARSERRIELHPARDGMGWLNAYLPADDAAAVYITLTALADAAPPGDARAVDARRADALVDTVTRYLDAGECPDGRPLPRRHGRRPHLNVTAAATTVLGLDDLPGDLSGYGPIPASMVREIASRSLWRPLLVDAESGVLISVGSGKYRPATALTQAVLTRDVTCTFPGCRVPAQRCDIDHIEPYDPERPAVDQTIETNLQPLCRHHHRLKTHGGWTVFRERRTGASVWTSPTDRRYRREAQLPNAPPPGVGQTPQHATPRTEPSVGPTAPSNTSTDPPF